MARYVLGITGASGPILGARLLREIARGGHEVHVIASTRSLAILKEEAALDWTLETEPRMRAYAGSALVFYYDESHMYAPVASGSFITEGMFVVPCSMKSLAGIATGYAENLLQRAADVTIKEGRRLVLCPREMPLSAIHLENMLKLARLGVRIAPPVPAFYQKPKDLEDMLDFLVGKLLDAMGIEHSLYKRWEGR